jgi:5-methylcytosine-specific restriction protein A
MFGPAKFIGLADMTFGKYEQALAQLDEAAFDGGRTHVAIERALKATFAEDEAAHSALTTWAETLLGAEAFGGADESKWRFITMSRAQNPDWQRDELILALDLYLRSDRRVLDDNHPDVIALSELLNQLPIHAERPDAGRFRNPNGVALKLANFRAIDQPGKGMSRGNRLERIVWEDFAENAERLCATVATIVAGYNAGEVEPQVAADEDEDEAEFPEGRIVYRLHRARERNAELTRWKKRAVQQSTGRLACEVCDFDFAARYGALGEGFIESHHIRPLSELAERCGSRGSKT